MEASTIPEHLDDEAPADAAPAGSILGSLRARREEVATSTPRLVLDVPGYDVPGQPTLAVRYRYPEAGYKAITGAMTRARASKDADAELNANCDTVLACVESVVVRKPDGSLVHLVTEERIDEALPVEPPVIFDRRLAEMFGIVVPSEVKGVGRFVLRHVFSPRAATTGIYDGDLALMTQGGEVITWLQNVNASVDEDFAGE